MSKSEFMDAFHILQTCRLSLPPRKSMRFPHVCVSLCLLFTGTLAAAEPSADDLKFFAEKVEPVLVQHCYGCHGNGKERGGFNFYTREALLKGGESGAAVDFNDVAGSLLIDAINYASLEMPPSGKMPQERIDIVTDWVKRGAPMPERTDVHEIERGSPQVNDETRAHWAFQKVKRPAVPDVQQTGWVKNPIDAFILNKLEANSLQPATPADRRTLIRRVYYDLLGLPPSPEEVDAFIKDDRPEAYAELVETLLNSPHYGEHWARYWLDLVRYAESNSFERDNPKPFVWRYRDYVIQAFNRDVPYDQFILEQLAGDELPQPTKDALIATGFYRLGAWDDEPADPLQARYDELDDIITTTAQGFLGLTMNCCRCHDHKLDPIPQADYYRFLAFFAGTERYGLRSDDSVYQRSIRNIATPEEQAAFQQQLSEHNAKVDQLRAELDAAEARMQEHLVGGEKDDFKRDSVRLDVIRHHIGKHITQAEFDIYASTRKQWTDLRNHPPRSADQALCIKESGSTPPATRILGRGNPHVPGDEVQPGFPEVLGMPTPSITPLADGSSSGRRRVLADWIASPENPLTARVMVNRIWQGHFGRGIVRSSNNFGLQGDRPTHPQLLDWLAAEFVEHGWSIKHLHRLILMSSTYLMSSSANEKALANDPQNDLFWRFDMRRLRAEEIRDSILAVNGSLNLDKLYGPSMYPDIPAEVMAGQSRPGANWEKSSEEEKRRRSIYIHIKRSLTVPLMAAFDVADADFTCPVRFATTQPTQALGMLNSEFLNQQARVMAEHARQQAGNEPARQVDFCLHQTLQRTPTQAEIDRGVQLMQNLQQQQQLSADQALQNFCLLALNLNEFIYLD